MFDFIGNNKKTYYVLSRPGFQTATQLHNPLFITFTNIYDRMGFNPSDIFIG